jgi:hypothetical protein
LCKYLEFNGTGHVFRGVAQWQSTLANRAGYRHCMAMNPFAILVIPEFEREYGALRSGHPEKIPAR